jgi:hypothetical protein
MGHIHFIQTKKKKMQEWANRKWMYWWLFSSTPKT